MEHQKGEEVVHRILNPEQIAKLQESGILGLNVDDIIYYTPKVYRENPELFPDKKSWSVYKLKPLDGIKSAKIEGELGHIEYEKKEDGVEVSKWVSQNGPTRINTLREHILDWKNHYGKKGEIIPFRKNGTNVHNDCLGTIRQALQIELLNAITEGSSASEEELEGLGF